MLGIDLVVDSTGLKAFVEGEWATHQIVAEVLTDARKYDADQCEPLLNQFNAEVRTFYGDGAYDQ